MALLEKTYPLITSATEYWLSLLGAVLSCLHNHKGLQHRPDTYDLPREVWSLRDFRGHLPLGAFVQVKASMENWGFQYLFADILNDRALPYMGWLKDGLSQVKGLDLRSSSAVAYVSGTDSYSARDLEPLVKGHLLSDLRRTLTTAREQVRHTDLCVVLQGAREYPIIALGEVEGNHGERVRRPTFWANKSAATNFGIGVVDGSSIQFDFVETEQGQRFVMLFGSNQGFARDFREALDWVEYLLREGPHHRQRNSASVEPGLRDALGYIAGRFNDAVINVLDDLRRDSVLKESQSKIPLLDENGLAPARLHTPNLVVVSQ
jgi:hypothetical protein